MEPGTRWRVLLDTTPRRLGRWLALSIALHAPLTPVAGFLGLFRLLNTDDQEVPDLPPINDIPLDLIDDTDFPRANNPAEAPEAREPEFPAEPATPKTPDPVAVNPKEIKDAGTPDARPEIPDAGVPDASKESDAGLAQDAGPGDAGPAHKPGEGIGSPALAAGDKRVVDPNALVQVLVHNDRVRAHPLGARVGPLLRNVYQWRDFFGPTAIDPIQDIDRMLIVGPQLRDSRQVTALLQFNIPRERVRAAVDTLVARDPEGKWLDGPVPVALAHADRNERAFVLSPQKVLIVTEPRLVDKVKGFKRQLPPPGADEIAIVQLATPWRAFLGLRVVIPKSITSARLRLSPRPDGGIVIDILAHDETEPLAVQDAQTLTAALQAATSLDLGMLGAVLFGSSKKKFIEKGSFEADGTDIRGEIVMTRQQVETAIDLAGGLLAGQAPKPRAPSSATAPALPAPVPSAQ